MNEIKGLRRFKKDERVGPEFAPLTHRIFNPPKISFFNLECNTIFKKKTGEVRKKFRSENVWN
jgi:hypothetical protein